MKHVRVIQLAGATISGTSKPGETVDLFHLVTHMPEFQGRIELSYSDRTDLAGGYMMQPRDIVEAAGEIHKAAAEGADGVVIIMGTDCLEEGSFGMDLLTADLSIPMVVTGGMCTADMYSPDGPGNLFDAVNAAVSDQLQNLGVVVVCNGWIHAAEYVQKLHPSNRAAFSSEFPLGMVCEGDVSIRCRPIRRRISCLKPNPTLQKKVLLQTCCLGIDDTAFNHIEEDGYAGIVVAGTGGCDVVPPIFDKLEALREKYAGTLPIVIGTRIGKGEPLMTTYGEFVGSPSYIARNYLITGQLDCLKARILLTLLLMSECTYAQIQEAFRMFYRATK